MQVRVRGGERESGRGEGRKREIESARERERCRERETRSLQQQMRQNNEAGEVERATEGGRWRGAPSKREG